MIDPVQVNLIGARMSFHAVRLLQPFVCKFKFPEII